MSVQVSYKKQGLFFLLVFIGFLILLESGARIYEYSEPDCFLIGTDAMKNIDIATQKLMCSESKSLKIIQKPVYAFEPNQQTSTININSLGFRGVEFDLIKNEDTYRIIMVGGSTTFGSGSTSDNTTIPGFLEQKFHEEKFNNIEIINAGNRAASSFEEAYSIRSNYKNLQPDLFIIYDGWNDSFRNNPEKDLGPSISSTELKQSKKSALDSLISELLLVYRTPAVVYPLIQQISVAVSLTEEVMEKNSDIWSSRWNKICDENNDAKIKTIILLQPVVGTGNKILSSDEKIHAEYFKGVKTVEHLKYFAKKLPLSSCTMSVDLRNAFDNMDIPIYFDGGHMTDIGNEIIAEKIYEKISPIVINDIKKLS